MDANFEKLDSAGQWQPASRTLSWQTLILYLIYKNGTYPIHIVAPIINTCFLIFKLHCTHTEDVSKRQETINFRSIKSSKQDLSQQLYAISNTKEMNSFTTSLIDIMHAAVKASFRLRSVRKTRTFCIWISELTKKRNHLTAIRRKLKAL